MQDLNYRHLRYFWAVAHDGNLTRAAEALNLSQSALSVQIRRLEMRIGHDLFERRGRTLHLTEAGRIALDHADAIFAAGRELVSILQQTGAARQILKIGALATLSRNFQLDFLRPLLDRPDVEIVLRSGGIGELLLGLEALQLDMILLNRPPAADRAAPFILHRLAEQRVSLIGTPRRLKKGGDLAALLAAHPVLLPSPESGVRIAFDGLIERLGVRPKIAAEVEDMAMLRLLARADLGLAILPPIVVKDELAAGRLIEADRLPGIVETFYAVTMKRRFPNPLLRHLLRPEKPRADRSRPARGKSAPPSRVL